MTEATAVMPGSERAAAAAEKTTDVIMHSARRLWLAGLGTVAVAAEQAQIAFDTLGNKGEAIEPTVVAPFKWASDAANSLAQRAGQSVKNASQSMKNIGGAVNNATAGVAGVGRRLKAVDMGEEVSREEVSRIVDEKLAIALKQLDLVSRNDLQAVADRIDELLPKSKRGRESHAD